MFIFGGSIREGHMEFATQEVGVQVILTDT
jgi:hypothetical protein